MQLPTSKALADAIIENSLSQEEKEYILKQIPYLNKEKIIKLYSSLLKLQKEEQNLKIKRQRLALKYKIKIENEIENAKGKL